MTTELELPGFRFHPTEDELLNFYLKNMVFGKKIHYDIIGLLNIYHHDPWDLPGLSKVGEREWYFFVPRDRKHGSGGRPNRTTEHGFWKATGSDRKIVSLSDPKRIIGLKKTLVFYEGRAPKGHKTDWVMNEYRLPDGCPLPKDIVLCKIYRKATSLKVLEQRAMEEDQMKTIQTSSSPPSTSLETISFCGQQEEVMAPMPLPHMILKQEEQEVIMVEEANIIDQGKASGSAKDHQKKGSSMSLQLPQGKTNLPELQLPKMNNNMDWTQDPVWSQFSPWLQNLAQNITPSYANVLNF